MFIRFITTGGTIDKIYFDALSQFEVGESQIAHILSEGLVDFSYEIVPLLRKDSLEITATDRRQLREYIEADEAELIVVTHGTDTMPATAEALQGIPGKTIVLTGALSPARFRTTDAVFNIGMAVAAVQCAAPGVYIAMSGQVFPAGAVRKNRSENRFERVSPGDEEDSADRNAKATPPLED
ncbi:MAG TPA: asparaginase domain-containing protein [Woeseiaceae bacterium]|nr:asparaginase domain-containing protein [Woeseiaceae bacterium]